MALKDSNKLMTPITPEEVKTIDPYTIAYITLLNGTLLVVQNSTLIKNNLNQYGGKSNNQTLKTKKKSFSYIEWDFPDSKPKNNNSQLKTDLSDKSNIKKEDEKANENNNNVENDDNNNLNNNSKTNSVNRKNNISKNYSFYESKSVSKKPKDIPVADGKNKSNNNVMKEIKVTKKDPKKTEENEKNASPQKEIIPIEDEKVNFKEKIKLVRYGFEFGDKNEEVIENNIKKINKIKPLNIVRVSEKNKEDINLQFNKLLNKFNENKNNNKKERDDNSYWSYKNHNTSMNNMNKGNNIHINQLNYFINKTNGTKNFNLNLFNANIKNKSKEKNITGLDLNERLIKLRKKSISQQSNNLENTNGSQTNALVFPANFD